MGTSRGRLAPVAAGREAQANNFHTHYTASEAISAFSHAMRAAGIGAPDHMRADGALHRFKGDGDKRPDCWYFLHLDNRPAGAGGSWRTGITQTWKADGTPPDSEEQRRFARIIQAEKRKRAVALGQRQQRAAARATHIRRESQPADADYPYLTIKGVRPHNARQRNKFLVLSLYDFDGRLCSLQFIGPDGDKKLLKGGRKQGCFIPVHGRMPTARVLICEGWATGATLAEHEPEALVLAAVDAGNLKAVSTGARNQWPDAEIVVCADADDVGKAKAREAAIAAGALLSVPEFPPGATGSDYNDLAALRAGGAL